jgi:hypothetical protein
LIRLEEHNGVGGWLSASGGRVSYFNSGGTLAWAYTSVYLDQPAVLPGQGSRYEGKAATQLQVEFEVALEPRSRDWLDRVEWHARHVDDLGNAGSVVVMAGKELFDGLGP